MSYDVSIFLNDDESDLVGLSIELNNVLGLTFSDDFEVRVLGLEFELLKRRQFLRDEGGMEFSKYSYQLDITSRTAGTDIIHPVGFMIAETLSVNLKGQVMLCLSSVEFLGAVFSNGKLESSRMTEVQGYLGKVRWQLNS